MRTIAIMNNKGGVGKTVTAINLADILVRDYKKRVLLSDCDGQCNLTDFFFPALDEGLSVAEVLTGTCEPLWSDNIMPIRDGLDLLPGSEDCIRWTCRPSFTAATMAPGTGCGILSMPCKLMARWTI